MSTELIILGGFLGAGKTTLMLKLAEQYSAEGRRVALITNDQGDLLVDTGAAREMGFPTGQVSSGCFCCHFSDFMDNVDRFLSEINPDLIIAEPVGSCTDLVSTLAAPIQNFYKEKLDLKGIFVLVDVSRLSGSWSSLDLENPATPEEVLLAHQIREAGSLLLSKSDLVEEDVLKAGEERLRKLNPHAVLNHYSALDPNQVDQMAQMMMESKAEDFMLRSVELDYEVYAEAEAELGWYNGTWEFSSGKEFSLSDYLMSLSRLFEDPDLGEVSHGKLFIVSEDSSIKLSFVDGIIRSDSVQTGNDSVRELRTIVNIRSKAAPHSIEKAVEAKQAGLEKEFGGRQSEYVSRSLIPSPPEPEHRIIL